MKPRPVLLLTDFGSDSFFVGVMKCAVLGACPQARVIDITHSVPAGSISQGGYVLSIVWDFLPEDAVVVAVVDPGVGSERRALAVDVDARTLLAPDNGLGWEAIGRRAHRCFELDRDRVAEMRANEGQGATFDGRDLFAPAAGALAGGARTDAIGQACHALAAAQGLPPLESDAGRVRGYGRFVDSFGNVLTNISTAALRDAFGDEPKADLRAHVARRDIGALRATYADASDGEMIAVRNSWDRIEVAVVGGSAHLALGSAPVESIAVEVYPGA